jgi:hypothetical protein
MSEEISAAGADSVPTATQATKLNLLSVLQFLKDNFIVVSGLAAVGGLAFSTIFLSAYLWVFDWHLIWFVQSADVITFGLIAAGVIGSSLLLLYSISHTMLDLRLADGRINWSLVTICGVIVVAAIAFQIYGEHARHSPHYYHLAAGWVTIFGVLSFLFVVQSHFNAGTWPTISQSMGILFGAITATVSFGNWVALTVAESPEIAQDVVTKDQTFSGVKVVIVMSRHTILLRDDNLLVIPTADITQFKGKGSVLLTVTPTSNKKEDTVPPAR